MANLIGTPTYVNVLRQLETTDPAHPNTWNPNYQALINNDAYLKGFIEGLMKAATGHKHSGVDGDGAKIPISSITEDIVTKAELNAHIGSRGSAHAIVTTTEDGFMSKTDKSKLDGIAAGANNYTHPSTHPASIITEETNKRFMTDAERTKLSGIAAGANNYVHPANHPASIITQDANNRLVTDAEKTTWNAKETTTGAQTKANSAEGNAKQYSDQQLNAHKDDGIAHNRYGTATGTNALVATLTPAPSKLVAGFTLRFKNTTANTGTVILNVNGLGAKPIVKNGGVALSAGDLKASGVYTVCYDGTNFILQGEGGEYGTATAPDVKRGKTIGTENGIVSGTADVLTATTSLQTGTGQTFEDRTIIGYDDDHVWYMARNAPWWCIQKYDFNGTLKVQILFPYAMGAGNYGSTGEYKLPGRDGFVTSWYEYRDGQPVIEDSRRVYDTNSTLLYKLSSNSLEGLSNRTSPGLVIGGRIIYLAAFPYSPIRVYSYSGTLLSTINTYGGQQDMSQSIFNAMDGLAASAKFMPNGDVYIFGRGDGVYRIANGSNSPEYYEKALRAQFMGLKLI